MSAEHVVVIGAGIVGLATAHELTGRGYGVTVLDKEQRVAAHQTGRNSGVIHSGLYYAPGSLKARLGVAGAASMLRFAREHGVDVEVGGKLVVATARAAAARAAGAGTPRRGQRRPVPGDRPRGGPRVRAARQVRGGAPGRDAPASSTTAG